MNSVHSGIMVCTHRGFTANAPENSLQAVRDAIGAGFRAAEIDVRHTRDDVLVLMHDPRVDRTTDGHGQVDMLSYAEIKRLKLLWRNMPFAEIPSLSEVLELADGRTLLYIDMKTEKVELIVAMVQKYRAHDWTILLGDIPKISLARRLDADVNIHTVVNSKSQLEKLLRSLRPAMVEVSRPPDPEYLAYAHSQMLPVELDTMGKPDLLATRLGIKHLWKRYLNSGVDFVMSNAPHKLRLFMRELGIVERQRLF